MKRLENTITYLCGPMDRVKDGGVAWRQMITPKLHNLGVGVLDPCDKPSDYAPEDFDTRNRIHKLKEEGNWDEVARIMKPIANIDLRMVDIAHFIIMYMDVDVHLCGSYHEAFVAIAQKKPLLVMNEGGKATLPNWMFGVMPHEMVFGSWDELLGYLEHVHSSPDVEDFNRWRFFDSNKIFGKEL